MGGVGNGREVAGTAGSGAFAHYDLDPRFFDELFREDGTPRAACRRLGEMLARVPAGELARVQDGVHRRFLHEGITFTVLGQKEVSEHIIPIDCVPRIMKAAEWQHIEDGIKQRMRAVNLFLRDIYNEGNSLRDGVVPPDLVLGCPQYRVEMRGVKVPHDVYVAVGGTDIVRTNQGFAVIEDNMRVPSGVSYMLACRAATKRALPTLYREHRVREVSAYPERLYSTLVSLSARAGTPRVAVLTPGRYNSAYYEHAFLAGQMGADLVEGRDLVVHNAKPLRAHVVGSAPHRRHLPPHRRRLHGFGHLPLGLGAGRGGHVPRVPGGQRGSCERPRHRCGGRQGGLRVHSRHHSLFPGRGAHPGQCGDLPVPQTRGPRPYAGQPAGPGGQGGGGSGGYGMLVGPQSTAREREEYADRLRADPTNFISQPVLALSRASCFVDGSLQPRHVDVRPFTLHGRDGQSVVPGGLCRVALQKGNLVVNSSQGGGCKDLWVLRD